MSCSLNGSYTWCSYIHNTPRILPQNTWNAAFRVPVRGPFAFYSPMTTFWRLSGTKKKKKSKSPHRTDLKEKLSKWSSWIWIYNVKYFCFSGKKILNSHSCCIVKIILYIISLCFKENINVIQLLHLIESKIA